MKVHKERAFSIYHPIVSFTYFLIVIIASMFFMHPVFIAISLVCSVMYASLLDEDKTEKIFLFGLMTALGIAIINVIFVHRGATVLFYLRENPVTFESLMYGVCSGGMMLSVVLWFSCYNEIITSEKFLYIFGRLVPSIALMISMTLRLIPKLINQTKIIAASQKTMGLDCSSGPWIKRAKSSMRILSILVTWALEDGVETADSMKARGYGLKGRTNFSIFVFTKRDGIMLAFIIIMTIILGAGYLMGISSLRFYPKIAHIPFNFKSIVVYVAFFSLGIMPSLLEIMEDIKWKQLK